jgi:hypothetical protein
MRGRGRFEVACMAAGVATAAGLMSLSSLDRAGGQDRRPPGVLEASKVVIRDERGTVRIVLGVAKDGESAITLFDAKGKEKIVAAVDGDGTAMVRLKGKAPDQLAMISTLADGSAEMRVGTGRGISVMATAGGQAVVVARDGSDPIRMWGVDERGEAIEE